MLLRFLCVALFAVYSLGNLIAADKPNVLLICVDDLRPELKCFGKDYIRSPNIDALAANGRAFHRHYVQAPTCGASRYALLTGTYGPASNSALFQRAATLSKNPDAFPPSMPAWFRSNGYTTVSVGKVSHHPGGRGGKDWDDNKTIEMPFSWDRHLLPAGPWQHPRGAMHGLANGEIRVKAGEMDVFQAVDGPDTIYPDGLIVDEALSQLDELADADKPFFLAVGIIRPHLPFGAPKKYLDMYEGVELPPIPHPSKPEGKTTWHGSGEFMKYNRWKRNPNDDAEFATEVRRHYAACVTYADAQVGKLIQRLKSKGRDKDTIIVLWGDHGWHLGEHAIWGKHALFEESLHSPLIISYPGMRSRGESSQAMVETIDLFPSLCEIAGLPRPEFVDGVSLMPILKKPSEGQGHAAIGYGRSSKTIRTDTHRLIVHRDGYIELYDHRTEAGETKNLAKEQPNVAEALLVELQSKFDGGSKFRPDQSQLPAKAPKGAVSLFDGSKKHHFLNKAGEPINWPIEDGNLVCARGEGRSNHLVSSYHFRDADIHVEFNLPEMGSGNSGVYIHGNYEVQIINSVGKTKLTQGEMGAVYGFAPPLINAARKPGEWQVLDIRYRAPRRNDIGEIVVQGSITAWLNGHRVQHNTRFGEPRSKYHPYRYNTTPYLTTIWEEQKKTSVGPVFLQDHDNPVRFRNVWIKPLDKLSKEYTPTE